MSWGRLDMLSSARAVAIKHVACCPESWQAHTSVQDLSILHAHLLAITPQSLPDQVCRHVVVAASLIPVNSTERHLPQKAPRPWPTHPHVPVAAFATASDSCMSCLPCTTDPAVHALVQTPGICTGFLGLAVLVLHFHAARWFFFHPPCRPRAPTHTSWNVF